jgi:hypothetical protein
MTIENTPWFGKGKVGIGFCYGPQTITGPWRTSYTRLLSYEWHGKDRVNGEYPYETGGPGVPAARNEIVKAFLSHPDRVEWLLFLDTDASFPENLLDILLESADQVTAPIVSGLAFRLVHTGLPNPAGASPFELQPVIYRLREGEGADYLIDYPINTMVRCSAVGAHCLLIHRSVLEDPRWLEDKHPHTWFRVDVSPGGNEVSEDFFFSRRANSFGIPIWVNTSAKTGHVKHIVLDEDFYFLINGNLKGKELPIDSGDLASKYAFLSAENQHLKSLLDKNGISYA